MQSDEQLSKMIGVPLDKVVKLYMCAVQNDWRTVQSNAQEALARISATRTSAAEAAELLNLTRSILVAENGDHIRISGLADRK